MNYAVVCMMQPHKERQSVYFLPQIIHLMSVFLAENESD